MIAQVPFWQRKRLHEMTPEEWESLCDGCGKCCLNKLEDEDTGEVYHTDLVCRYMDEETCQCTVYEERGRRFDPSQGDVRRPRAGRRLGRTHHSLDPVMIDTDAQLAYGIFWAAYAIAFVVFFYMMKSLIRFLPFYGVRTLILAALVALLLTPVESPDLAGWWIPAWLFGGYEMILGDADASGRAMFNLGLAGLVMLLVWVLDLVRYRLVRK